MIEEPPNAGAAAPMRMRLTVLWGVGLSFATKVGSFILTLALARLLRPEIFGQYATVNAIILFLMAFSMERFNESLFFEKTPSDETYHRHLGFGVMLHTVLFALANLIAFAMGFIAKLAVLQGYVHLASLAILLNVPRIYYVTYLKYQLDWKRIRTLTAISFLLYAGAALAIAWLGGGVFALLTQNLLIPVPFVVGLAFADPRLKKLRFDLKGHGRAIRFGAARTMSNILLTGYQTAESLAFSFAASFTAYGFFNRAKGLALQLSGIVSDQTGAVVFPVLAKMKPKTDGARRAAGQLLRVSIWSAAPLAMTGAIAPRPLVDFFYGVQWDMVVPLVRPMLAAAVASSLWTAGGIVFLTNEGARRALFMDACLVGANLASLIVLPIFGLQTFVYVFSIANVAVTVGQMIVLVLRQVLAGPDLLRVFAPCAALLAAGSGLAVFPPYQAFAAAQPLAGLALAGALCGLVMVLGARVLDARGLSSLCDLLPARRLTRRLLLLPRS